MQTLSQVMKITRSWIIPKFTGNFLNKYYGSYMEYEVQGFCDICGSTHLILRRPCPYCNTRHNDPDGACFVRRQVIMQGCLPTTKAILLDERGREMPNFKIRKPMVPCNMCGALHKPPKCICVHCNTSHDFDNGCPRNDLFSSPADPGEKAFETPEFVDCEVCGKAHTPPHCPIPEPLSHARVEALYKYKNPTWFERFMAVGFFITSTFKKLFSWRNAGRAAFIISVLTLYIFCLHWVKTM